MKNFLKNVLLPGLSSLVIGVVIVECLLSYGPFKRPCKASVPQVSSMETDVNGLPCVSIAGWACFDPYTGFWARRNLNIPFAKACYENKAGFRTDNFGLNDRGDYKADDKQGKFRIAVFGDSMTQAFQVAPDENFSALLERFLGKDAEVLNFGQSGYNTHQEYMAYLYKARQFKPDMVIVALLTYNDIMNNDLKLESCYQAKYVDNRRPWPVLKKEAGKDYLDSSDDSVGYTKPMIDPTHQNFDPVLHKTAMMPYIHPALLSELDHYKIPDRRWHKAESWLVRHSTIFCLFWNSDFGIKVRDKLSAHAERDNQSESEINRLRSMPPFEQCPAWPAGTRNIMHGVYRPPIDSTWQEAWDLTETTLRLFKKSVEEDGGKFVLMSLSDIEHIGEHKSIGFKHNIAQDYPADYDVDYPSKKLTEISQRNGIDYLNVIPALEAYRDRHQLPYPWFVWECDGHYNPLGHYAVSNTLARFLIEKQLLPENLGTASVAEAIEDNLSRSPADVLGSHAWKALYEGGIYQSDSNLTYYGKDD